LKKIKYFNKINALQINCYNSFFNLSNNTELSTVSSFLKYGLKHIPNSGDLTNTELLHTFSKFKHKLLWQSYHSNCLSSDHLNFQEEIETDNYNKKLKNRFTDYHKFPKYLYPHLNKTLLTQLKQLKEATVRYSKRFPPDPKIDNLLTQILNIKEEYPEIIFKPADKNIGTVAMTLTQYDKLVMDHLNNTDNYAFISNHEKSLFIFEKVKKRLNTLLDEDKTNNNILFTSSEYKFIKSFNNPTIPHFYVLPKLHKGLDNLKGRPICSSLNWFTTPIAVILEIRLQQYIKENLIHSIKNSISTVKDIEILNSMNLSNITLATGDVESLYPNIKIIELLDVFLKNPEISYLEPLVRFITRNNFVQYCKKVYLQLKGIAMGSNAAVALAEIYMFTIYDKIIHSLMHSRFSKLIYFKRYIDDYFLILQNCNHDDFKLFTDMLPNNLKINWECPKLNVEFLDININFLRDQLETSVHQKSLNKYLYITPHSMHTKHTFAGFIKGELIRYARLSSNIYKYLNLKTIFYERLRNRGFAHAFLIPIFKRVNWTIRFEKNYKKHPKTIAFVIPHTYRAGINSLKNEFYRISSSIKIWNQNLKFHNLRFVNSRRNNIAGYLTPTKLTEKQILFLEKSNATR
jgi:hypothetical protein